MKMTRQPLICALSLAAVLALSACSGHNDDATNTAAPTPNTAPSSTAATPPAASTAMTPPAASTAMTPPASSTAMSPPSASTAGH
jgi:protein dithiol oxidoreductase (disulfide-forming)